MINRNINILLAVAALIAAPVAAIAAEPVKKGESFNVILVGLVTLVFVLLLVIALLGNVLVSLLSAYRQKLHADKSKSITGRIVPALLLLILPAVSFAQDAVPDQAPKIIAGLAAFDFYLIIGLIVLELGIIISLLGIMALLVRLLSNKPETAQQVKAIIRTPFWDRFNKAVAVDEEQGIILDHEYDGIQELDNSLPPWWKYGFYLTIIVSVIYMYYYHIGGDGPGSLDEYAIEVRKGEEQKAAYLALSANNVDENTVKMLEGAAIASGGNLFQASCAACHAKDGGGGVGPNLADDYWLHGGSMKDVFKSIKYGWPDKGMKSWKDDFSPKQIAELSSYVKSLKGTTPAAPKDKQGDLYQEEATATTDTTGVAINGK